METLILAIVLLAIGLVGLMIAVPSTKEEVNSVQVAVNEKKDNFWRHMNRDYKDKMKP